MDTQFQDLQWVIDRCIKEFSTKPNREITPLFRLLRSNNHYSLFGDYFLLWSMAEALRLLNKPIKRNLFSRACLKSEEYRGLQKNEKMQWLNSICGTWKK